MESTKCDLCDFVCESRGSYLDHLESHEGATLSCRSCHKTFRNKYLFLYHKEASMCDNKSSPTDSQILPNSDKNSVAKQETCIQNTFKVPNLKKCSQCNMTFQFQRHFIKHMEGHKRNNCKHCSALFTNRKELMVHVAAEHRLKLPEADYQCKFCDKKFGRRRILFKHYSEHANGQQVCIYCGKFFKTAEEHKAHEEKHEENKQWKCERCHECFARKQQYLMHMKDHEKYQCPDCEESFASKSKFRNHKLNIHDIRNVERTHQCSECGQQFSRPRRLMLHFRIHTGEKPYVCNVCGKRYHTSRGYIQHLDSSAHQKPEILKSTIKAVKCPDCGLEFATKHLMDRHALRAHKQELSYKCEICDQLFNCKENLKRHIALHTEERQFVCEQCAAAFHSMNALKDHISYIHSIVREFVCAKCGMSFKRNSGLNRHMASHSEDRPFVCRCGIAYKRSSHLRRHKETMHGEVLKSQKLVRLKQDESGTFVPVEDNQQVKKNRRRKKQQECLEEENQEKKIKEKEQNVKTVVISLSEVHTSPLTPLPPPAPPPVLTSVSPSSFPLSTLGSSPAQPSSSLDSSFFVSRKRKLKALGTLLSLVDTKEVEEFHELCDRDSIINNTINLESEDLTTVTETTEISDTDESRTSSFSGNVLHTIVSYNMTDFPTSVPSTDSQLVFTSSVPVSSINIDRSHRVLTLTFDPLLDSETNVKHSDSFSQQKNTDENGEGSLLLDPSVSSHLTLDNISDSLYIPSVTLDRASTLITSGDTVLSSSAVPLPSDENTVGSTLISSSDSSTLGNSSALFNSVDATFGALQHSEVLLNMQSHIDSQPYALPNNLNISVSDCESLLSSQNSHSHNSPSLILTQETEESIGLDGGNTVAILSDYLHPNFSFLNV